MNNNRLPSIKRMFDSISPRYDLLNRILSFGCDIYWRKKMVSKIKTFSCFDVLDAACGTGDITFEISKQMKDLSSIVGLDFSKKMLKKATEKIQVRKGNNNVRFVLGDVVSCPFAGESFDVITIAFGIRNVQNRLKVLKNFYSLLRNRGMLLILEISIPEKINFVNSIFMYYFERIMPVIGKIFSKNSFAYSYLFTSVLDFPDSKDFSLLMTNSGFSKVNCQKLTGGIVSLFVGYKL